MAGLELRRATCLALETDGRGATAIELDVGRVALFERHPVRGRGRELADDAGAAAATKAINDQLSPDRRGQLEGFVGKEFADSLAVDQQQSFTRITATMTADELDKVTSLVKMLM